ncbi:hypothetical protein VH569_25110 [Azospirillum sp. 11R-A]|uniref:YecA family protein n=1 Tax=Azospirillum sp. 11R-A TaxID=3111634 RepID=UPI003C1EF598
MVKRSRIDPCPCGSGRRKRVCHPNIKSADELSGAFFDAKTGNIIGVRNNILLNQIYRDPISITRSFDVIARKDLEQLSSVYADITYALLCYKKKHVEGDQGIIPTCAKIFTSTLQTVSASIQVARHGYTIEYGNLSRSIVEALSVIIQLIGDDEALGKFHNGKLKSPDSVSYAKKKFEVLGPLYGHLSKYFVHIGPAHAQERIAKCYLDGDEDIKFIVENLRATTFLVYIVCELVFFDEIKSPRFWEKISELEYKSKECENSRIWKEKILGINIGL